MRAAGDADAPADGQGTGEQFVQVFSRNLPTWVDIEVPTPQPDQSSAEGDASAQEFGSPRARTDRWVDSPHHPSAHSARGESPAGSHISNGHSSASRQLEPSYSPVRPAGYAAVDSVATREASQPLGAAAPINPTGAAVGEAGSPALQRLAATEQAVLARVAALRDSPAAVSTPAAVTAAPKMKPARDPSGGDALATGPQVRD